MALLFFLLQTAERFCIAIELSQAGFGYFPQAKELR